jgi:hypothetical protein
VWCGRAVQSCALLCRWVAPIARAASRSTGPRAARTDARPLVSIACHPSCRIAPSCPSAQPAAAASPPCAGARCVRCYPGLGGRDCCPSAACVPILTCWPPVHDAHCSVTGPGLGRWHRRYQPLRRCTWSVRAGHGNPRRTARTCLQRRAKPLAYPRLRCEQRCTRRRGWRTAPCHPRRLAAVVTAPAVAGPPAAPPI